jgi:hypothetical protein
MVAAMLCAQVAAINTVPSEHDATADTLKVYALHKPIPTTGTQGNVLISADNPDDDDINPKIVKNSAGTMVVVYEKVQGAISTVIPVAYSEDSGDTWVAQFEFDSIDFTEGSGVLNSPDIKYCPTTDEFFWQAIDPAAFMYNEEVAWIPGDIANAESAPWWGISSSGGEDYTYGALTYAGQFVVGFEVSTAHGFVQVPGLGYFFYDHDAGDVKFPSDIDPSWAAGFYYDGQSILETAPASIPEMATGRDRMYMVMQTDPNKISYKATYTDLDPNSDTFLFISGGGPGDMDKHSDIEVWPFQQYLSENAVDPDISASGSNVCVVYTENGNVICRHSSDHGDNFGTTTVATGAGYPAVYASGNDVFCAYVQNGNVYKAVSNDGGASFGAAEQLNDVDGTVAAESGSVDIIDTGVVWVDTRGDAKDIYFGGKTAAPQVVVESISGGFGVSATIGNVGNADATNVAWTITIDATLMILGGEVPGEISTLAAGDTEDVSSGFVLGFGPATVTVAADGASKQASGFVLGPFVLGLS